MSIYDFKFEITEFIHIHLGGKLPNTQAHYDDIYKDVEVVIREPIDGYSNHWVLSALGTSILVDNTALTMFTAMLENFDPKRVDSILSIIDNDNDKTISVRPYIPVKESTDNESLLKDDETLGVAYDSIDSRTDKLIKMIFAELGHINRLFEHGSTLYNKDHKKVKFDEVFIGYNTQYAGEKTAFFFCGTSVPPVIEDTNKTLTRSLEPMTDVMKENLFGYPTRVAEKAEKGITVLDDLEATLKRINDGIASHFKMVAEHKSELITEYAINKMNSFVIPAVVTTQTCEYTYFGGQDLNLTDYEEDDTNSVECSALIDEEMRKLFNHLDSIPVPEGSGIDHYAIDHDSLGIYGRDAQNKLVSAMVDERYQFYTSIEHKYSKSFLDIFKQNLKTVKNKHVFTQLGRIVRK